METEQKLLKNWTDNSARYSDIISAELNSFRKDAWTNLILQEAGKTEKMKILDVGTGPGFFSIILSLAGHDVTAIDCTQAMVDQATANASKFGAAANFQLADAHEPPFQDGSFDLVVSRNVLWTIMDADKALSQWRRVLKADGKMIAFDANWNIRLFDKQKRLEFERDHEEYRRLYPDSPIYEYTAEMDDYRRRMPLCSQVRPQWDLCAMVRAGYSRVSCVPNVGPIVYDEKERLLNRSTPMFMLVGEK